MNKDKKTTFVTSKIDGFNLTFDNINISALVLNCHVSVDVSHLGHKHIRFDIFARKNIIENGKPSNLETDVYKNLLK